ncbi:Brf1p family coiled coil protein, partial [Toxoplasma gondii MAS]
VAAPVCEGDLEPCMKTLEEKLAAAKELQATKAARVEARRQELQRELEAIDARVAGVSEKREAESEDAEDTEE